MSRVRHLLSIVAVVLCTGAAAETVTVDPVPGALKSAVAGASPGDVLILMPGLHQGPVSLDMPLTLEGRPGAVLQGDGTGSVVTVTGDGAVVRGLQILGSGNDGAEIDSGVKLARTATNALVEGNHLTGNLHGITVHGARDSIVRGNLVEGRRDRRVNDRGNGIYVWNAPGTLVEGNDVIWGRDGIFANASKDNIFRNNTFRDLRFAVHYMYTNNSQVIGNVSVGNTLGFALMFSNRIEVRDNLSLGDRTHGIMLNYANNATITGNLVRGGTHEKCTFIYNAHKNRIEGNRFEGCEIGIHFTAGSERNQITGNAFIGNRTQVKYVGTRHMEWSAEGRGNFWSDHPAFDLDGDGIADGVFRPNDLMDHILWSQPSAKLLLGSPAVQLVRWSQAAFPATLPGGVLDSAPLMVAPQIAVPANIAAMEAEARARAAARQDRQEMSDADLLSGH
ncbi:nitrous oxide reductase family maturation protein NosD [Maliponia aquimaris]|uniref:Periplasmic copper-binding protein (NosD) n=1 Tax=Maliponia aquimaris TaxID=1673631 RepID=A0A238L390_9RHOB|nr:nitrous oxide reductase family maturation protein NosD [Maliponia aquimaris]SMX49330.1 Periplasmic copper-binding protein (NosD) [Maliponia aquimaris]